MHIKIKKILMRLITYIIKVKSGEWVVKTVTGLHSWLPDESAGSRLPRAYVKRTLVLDYTIIAMMQNNNVNNNEDGERIKCRSAPDLQSVAVSETICLVSASSVSRL